jgi:hypothetical protein
VWNVQENTTQCIEEFPTFLYGKDQALSSCHGTIPAGGNNSFVKSLLMGSQDFQNFVDLLSFDRPLHIVLYPHKSCEAIGIQHARSALERRN